MGAVISFVFEICLNTLLQFNHDVTYIVGIRSK